MARKRTAIAAVQVTLLGGAFSAGEARAVDFIRGDLNGDGSTSIADAYYLLAHVFRGEFRLDCVEAGDADGNGYVNMTDALRILNRLFLGIGTIPAPYPDAGPPGASGLGCAAYGNGTHRTDPAAKLTVLDAVAPGGADDRASITLALSSSLAITGYSCTLLVGSSIAGSYIFEVEDLSGTIDPDGSFSSACFDGEVLRIAFLPSTSQCNFIPPGSAVPVLEISLCLASGMAAGSYPLTLSEGELVDGASGRAIRPALEGGELSLLSDLAAGKGCAPGGCRMGGEGEGQGAGESGEITARFELEGATATPGSAVTVPFAVSASEDVQGFAFSIDFDEEVLVATGITKLVDTSDGFVALTFNNDDETPGNGGVDEGFLAGAIAFTTRGNEEYNLPAGIPHEVLRFDFLVRPETGVSTTELRFLDGAMPRREHPCDSGPSMVGPVPNLLTAWGASAELVTADSHIFVNGLISVLPEISTFIRGDSNSDGTVNLSDAQHTLGYLFLGDARPTCYDAADANDDGAIDVSDPIGTLDFLFLGRSVLAPPFPDPGEDTTEDGYGCLKKHAP
jgi:hypothetical protein